MELEFKCRRCHVPMAEGFRQYAVVSENGVRVESRHSETWLCETCGERIEYWERLNAAGVVIGQNASPVFAPESTIATEDDPEDRED